MAFADLSHVPTAALMLSFVMHLCPYGFSNQLCHSMIAVSQKHACSNRVCLNALYSICFAMLNWKLL